MHVHPDVHTHQGLLPELDWSRSLGCRAEQGRGPDPHSVRSGAFFALRVSSRAPNVHPVFCSRIRPLLVRVGDVGGTQAERRRPGLGFPG
jgi:hypothetical protein